MNKEISFAEYVVGKFGNEIVSCDWKGEVYIGPEIKSSIGVKRFDIINSRFYNLLNYSEDLLINGQEAIYFNVNDDSIPGHVSLAKITKDYFQLFQSLNYENASIDYFVKFQDLQKVSLEQDGVTLYLKFHSVDRESDKWIELSFLGGKLRNSGFIICDIINNLINTSFDLLSEQIRDAEELKKTIENYLEQDEYEKALNNLELLNSKLNKEERYSNYHEFYYLNSILCQIELEEFHKALNQINIFLKQSRPEDYPKNFIFYLQSFCLFKTGSFQEALVVLNKYESDISEVEEIEELYDEIYTGLNENFLEIPLHKRSIVFVTDSGIQSSNLCILKRDNMPKKLQFPYGHPHINALYACHPLNNNLYMPVESYEKQLFEDKVNEFQRLMQALGATESLIVSASEKILIEDNSKITDVKADGANKLIKGKVSVGTENKNNSDITSYIKLSRRQRHEPINSPYVPDNLVWYQGEIAWQRLAEKRLNGNLLEDEMTLSTSQVENISKQRLLKIDAELKTLMANVNVGYSHNYASSVKSTIKYDCTIKVEFESVITLREKFRHLEQNECKEETSKLEKYAEEVQFMLDDDGVIDDMERKMLNRKAVSFGLTTKEQKNVENRILFQDYSEVEVKYIQEIEEFKKDGEITEMELKMLDRYATRFSLTETQINNLNQKFL